MLIARRCGNACQVLRRLSLTCLCGLLAVAAGSWCQSADFEVVRPASEYSTLTLRLESVLLGGEAIELNVGLRDRRPSQGWVDFPEPGTARRQAADVSQLNVSGNRLQGAVMLRLGDVFRTLQLDAMLADGRYTGRWKETYGNPQPTTTVEGTITGVPVEEEGQTYLFELSEAICMPGDERRDLRIILCMKDDKVVRAYAKGRRHNTATHEVNTSGLSIATDRISGTLRVQILPDQWVPRHGLVECGEYEIEATIKDGLVDGGKYTGRYCVQRSRDGALQGEIRTQEQLQRANALTRDKDWPRWSGPNGNLTALDGGHDLAEDLNDARLVWRSEAQDTGGGKVQPGWGHVLGGQIYPYGRGWKTGGGSPIVADGRLYLYYYRPTGDKYYINQEEIEVSQQKYDDNPTKRFFKGSYAIDADDVILCLDAATGRTLWRTVFNGKGLTCTSRKAGPNLTPCVADGKVFAMGTLGRLYCLDARTGEPLWESHIGSRFEQLVAAKANLLGTGPPARSGGGCGLNAALDYAEGVLLTFDHSGGLLGVDAKTGKHLWRVTSVIDTHIPVRWVHKKRAYVLVPRGSAIACVEPRTGNILWEMDGVAGNRGDALMAVDGDYLICQVNPGPTMACFRLSLGGGKTVWTLPEGWGKGQPLPYRGHVYFWGPAGRMCVELATGAVKTDQRNPEKRKFIGTITAGDGHIFQEVDSHHNLSDTDLYVAEPQRLRQIGTRWVPPHPNGGSYVTTMIHPYVDGRLFMRGYNGIYCYDLRRR